MPNDKEVIEGILTIVEIHGKSIQHLKEAIEALTAAVKALNEQALLR